MTLYIVMVDYWEGEQIDSIWSDKQKAEIRKEQIGGFILEKELSE